MRDAKLINTTYDLLAIVGKAVPVKKLSTGWYNAPCPFCGGTDRFTLHETPGGWRWHCRKCGDGKYHTTLDYVMVRDGCGFKDAIQKLDGGITPLPGSYSPKPTPQPKAASYTIPDENWQSKALDIILESHETLLGKPDGQGGRDYLLGRGITMGAVYYWLLGYAIVDNRPAILIPHLAVNQLVLAIKYRYLDAKDKQRFTSLKGSAPLLCGLQHGRGGDTLLLVEGELNAVSIWQCNHPGVDVISTGTENLTTYGKELIPQLAERYKRRVAWFDNPEKGKEAGKLLDASLILQSPIVDGVKYDGNELLKRGMLVEFLNTTLGH